MKYKGCPKMNGTNQKKLGNTLWNIADQLRGAMDADALITAETQKLEALKTHKCGLMQQLLPAPEAVEA